MKRTLLAVCAFSLCVPAFAENEIQFRLEAAAMVPVVFSTCSGIGSSSEVIEVRDGNSNTTFKGPGRTTFRNVTCSRPVTLDNSLYQWRKQVETGDPAMKKSFTIVLLEKNRVVKAWTFSKGWPVKWELSEFDASKNEVAIETLEIAHEGMELSQ